MLSYNNSLQAYILVINVKQIYWLLWFISVIGGMYNIIMVNWIVECSGYLDALQHTC